MTKGAFAGMTKWYHEPRVGRGFSAPNHEQRGCSGVKIDVYDFVAGDAMSTILPKRKQRAAPFKTSALESARRAGIAGVFAGPPDLAANRKKYLKEKLRGKAGTAR